NTSSVHPEEEDLEVQPKKPKAAAKPKSTTAKKADETVPKPKSRAKATAKPAAAVDEEAVPDEQPTGDPPKKKRTVKPKSAAAGTDAAAAKDTADAPAKPKAARATKSKAAAPPEEQVPDPEADHAETSAKADQATAKKRKKDAAHPEGDAATSSTAKAAADAPAAKKPRKSVKPSTDPCRICRSDAQHHWFDCPTILVGIIPPNNEDDGKALDAALLKLEERLKELVEEQTNDPTRETADLITSIKTSITLAKANQRGEPLVDEEEAPKKRRRTTSAKKKDGGDAAAAGEKEKEKGDGKKTSEVLPTSASTRAKETGPNAVPPSLSPIATATDLPANASAGTSTTNDNSPPDQTEEVGAMEVIVGKVGEEKTKKGGATEKAKKAAAQLPSKEAPERAKAPARAAPLPSAHVASETLVNSFTSVNSVNTTLAPEPRWSASPQPTSRPSKAGNASTVADMHGGTKKDIRAVKATEDTNQPSDRSTSNVRPSLARVAKTSGVSPASRKSLSYMDAFSPSEDEEEEEDSDGDVGMKNPNPSSASKTKSKPHSFLSPSPPPDLTPSRLRTTSKPATAPSVIRPRQETESESEGAPESDTRRFRTYGPPAIASSAKRPTVGGKPVAERAASPLRRPPAKGKVSSEGKSSRNVLVPGTPRQDGSSDEESSEEEEEEEPVPQPKKSGQAAAVRKGNSNATSAQQPTPKSISSIARPTKVSNQDITPKPQDRRPATHAKSKSVQKGKPVASSDSESSNSSDSEDEKAVAEAVKQSTKDSNTSDSSTSSKDPPTADNQRKPAAARLSALHSVSQTPVQKSFPSLQSLSSQPRSAARGLPSFFSQPKRPESNQARQLSDQNDSEESVDDSSDDDDVPKERRAGAGVQSLKKKASRLEAWS
ncbi:hypothetical protein FRC01_010162, partial [Tulasnella sp. 417]